MAAQRLEEGSADAAPRFRAACVDALQKASKPGRNLSTKTQDILAQLGRNEFITITNADKGGKLVVLDTFQYGELCLRHLQDVAYERVSTFGSGRGAVSVDGMGTGTIFSMFTEDFSKQDACDKLIRYQCQHLTTLITSLQKSKDMTVKERKQLLPPQPYSGVLTKFYGLPKIRKVGVLHLRPIISNAGLYSDADAASAEPSSKR